MQQRRLIFVKNLGAPEYFYRIYNHLKYLLYENLHNL